MLLKSGLSSTLGGSKVFRGKVRAEKRVREIKRERERKIR